MLLEVNTPRRRTPVRFALSAVAVIVLVAIAPAAAGAPTVAKEPPTTVSAALLKAAYHCHGALRNARHEPIMLVTGTFATGEETYAVGQGAFAAFGHPVCDVNFPDFETADIQVAVQYLVYAIRPEYKQSGRQIAVFAISQGGLLARFALTYWPDLRLKVSDVLGAAGTMHGNALIRCSASRPCTPAVWQQKAGSHLIAALDARSLRAPGPTSWTTVRSSTDEVVQPQTGKRPESALAGASNILIQRVCPGRKVSHVGTALDSVTFAAFVDAIAHQGAARVSRFSKHVCSHPYAPGLDPVTTAALLTASSAVTISRMKTVLTVRAEPKVRSYYVP
jgi:triacylglycerol lipase